MNIRVGTDLNPDDGLGSVTSLPLNQITKVRVEAIGPYVTLYLNNTQDTFVELQGTRSSGIATLYVSNPWHTPALARIGSIQMTPFSASSVSGFNGPISKIAAYQETVNVPFNYSLSFNITPTGVTSDWTNIIHYTGDNSDIGTRGRMPGTISLNHY